MGIYERFKSMFIFIRILMSEITFDGFHFKQITNIQKIHAIIHFDRRYTDDMNMISSFRAT